MLQHLLHLLQWFTLVAMQRHHALVRLLAGELVLGVERDGAAALAVHVEQRFQLRAGLHVAHDGGGGAEAEVRLHFHHRQLHRPVAKDLQHQRAIELDVGLHQHAGRRHLAQQHTHLGHVFAHGLAAAQDFLPRVIQPHQHAAHRQAFEEKLGQAAHQSIRRSPRRWR